MMKTQRILTIVAGSAAAVLVLTAALGATRANTDADALPDPPLPSFPGFAPTFHNLTVVDAETGEIVGMLLP
ncbi:hypothetical protein [Leifsonia sp. EB34]|uniref:hypothetical protein n=1 Tax=Leifsonia sp. EB34 TaxID=3156303 RepID=UPI0035172D53